MSRIARVVAEGIPHHVTQRGNGRQAVFFDAQDHAVYMKLLREYSSQYGLRIWAWCLMSNHVHLLGVPAMNHSLARALGRTHSEYARYRNARSANSGHLWQSRYYSCPVDGPGIWQVMAYIERNPVRAGLVESADDYVWSSARVHAAGTDDGFLEMAAWRDCYTGTRWREALRHGVDEEALQDRLRVATRTGRPLGSQEFIDQLERNTCRVLRPGRSGRRGKASHAGQSLQGLQSSFEIGG